MVGIGAIIPQAKYRDRADRAGSAGRVRKRDIESAGGLVHVAVVVRIGERLLKDGSALGGVSREEVRIAVLRRNVKATDGIRPGHRRRVRQEGQTRSHPAGMNAAVEVSDFLRIYRNE